MSDFQYDAEQHLLIDRKAYDRSALPEEVIRKVQLINLTDQELNRMNHDLLVFKAGRDAMVQELIAEMAEVPFLAEFKQEEGE